MKKSILAIALWFWVMLWITFAYNPCKDQYGTFATMSVYDHEVCVCMDWYVFNRAWTKCISESEALKEQDSICQDNYWAFAKWDGYAMCTCQDWYTFNKKKDKCITRNARCEEEFWSNSFSVWGTSCECKDWYVWNENRDKCISEDKSCQEQYGKNAISAPNNQCQCKSWYEWNEKRTECVSTSSLCNKLYWKYSTAWEEYWTCVCMDWYDWNKSQTECISKSSNKSCQEWYWENSIVWDGWCTCKAWYSWNLAWTACISSSNNTTANTNKQTTTSSNWFTAEENEAYAFAFANKITTMPTIEQANMKWKIIRAEIAKMFANWVKSLGYEPDTSKTCKFDDISWIKWDLYPAIIESCQLGIMGQWIKSFRPYDNITRWEVSTAISRILWWNKYDWWSPYYVLHMNALKYVGVLSDISEPEFKELRWNVMTMLMRASDKIDLDTLNKDLEMSPEYNNEDEVINYNDKMVDLTNKCEKERNSLEDMYERATAQQIKIANDNVLNICENALTEVAKMWDWKNDSSLKDAVMKNIASIITYYREFEKKIPYLDKNLTSIEEKELNSINAKLDELDAKRIDANENLSNVQKKFAEKHGYELDEFTS